MKAERKGEGQGKAVLWAWHGLWRLSAMSLHHIGPVNHPWEGVSRLLLLSAELLPTDVFLERGSH